MFSRPAVPLVDLLHSSRHVIHPNSNRRQHRPTPDGTQEVSPLSAVNSPGRTESSPPASLRNMIPQRTMTQPATGPRQRKSSHSIGSSTSQDPIPGHFANTPSLEGRPKPHPAPPILPEANPGVRTVWDEDWPNHRIGSTRDIDQHTRPDSVSRDWAYTTADRALRTDNGSPPPASVLSPLVSQDISSPGFTIHRIENETHGPSQPLPMTSPPIGNSTNGPSISFQPVENHRASARARTIPRHTAPTVNDGSAPENIASDRSGFPGTTYNATPIPQTETLLPNQWGSDKYDENDYIVDGLKRNGTVTLREGHGFSFNLFHRPHPIARNWSTLRKRFVASVTCLNTALVGILVGIYAGEVPAIQYILADQHHRVILGNVVFYLGMGVVVFIFWPLPLLHGRRPYTLTALAIALPLQIPQAVVIDQTRGTRYVQYTLGLLFARALSGLALGFAYINFKSTLLDLFGASLQSEFPHGEVVVSSDVRRHGGGMGLWLGLWSWCSIGSISIGFLIGADVISGLNLSWGFYIGVILIACALLLNVITPETRRAAHRRTVQEVRVGSNSTAQRVARGEVKMHVFGEGPRWWYEEVGAGLYLSFRMIMHTGFLVMALYTGWIYAEIVLVIVLLGNLLSTEYRFRPEYVGLGVLSIAIGALLSVPASKANIFSRARSTPARTDSMTFRPRITWTSHLLRRSLFMIALPIAGVAYTLASKGRKVSYMAPIILAGIIGFISNLALAECNGIIMETFDTSDLQPGANSRHRLQSLPASDRQRRTTYSSYPRVSAGFFVSQSFGFFLAAAATGVGGAVTRKVGAQKATAITASILFGLTLLLTAVLWRFKDMQVIPNELFGQHFGGAATGAEQPQRRSSVASMQSDRSWRAVIIGNPSGKLRRMSWLELGSLSRWTEIRRLNRLLNRSTTQGLKAGWR